MPHTYVTQTLAAALHSILALLIIVWFSTNHSWHNGDLPIVRLSAKQIKDGEMAGYTPTTEKIGTLPSVPLVLTFTIITALAHFAYAHAHKTQRGLFGVLNDPVVNSLPRYIEYAITATIMIIIIACISGVRELSALLLIGLASVATMAAGARAETTFQAGGNPWVPMWIGVAFFVASWVVIGWNFYNTTSDAPEAPSWLPAIFWSQLALFLTFPIITYLLLSNRVTTSYANTLFAGASFTTKAVLALLIVSAFVVTPETN